LIGKASWLTLALFGLVLGGCAAVGAGSGGAGETEIRSGKIEEITQTQMQRKGMNVYVEGAGN